jgi:hypothetical protein
VLRPGFFISHCANTPSNGVVIPTIAVGIAWAPDAFLRNILEGMPVLRKRGSIFGRCFEPPNDDIAIGGV